MPRYTTVDTLLKKGFRRFDNRDRIVSLIEEYSTIVNMYTDQVFCPTKLYHENIVLDNYNNIVDFPQRLPILDILKLQYTIGNYNDKVSLNSMDYIIDKRNLIVKRNFVNYNEEDQLRLSFGINMNKVRFNVEGIFGWIEKYPRPVEVITASEFDSDCDTLQLEDTSNIYPKDFLVLGNYCVLVDSVDDSTNEIKFDPIERSKTVATGSKGTVYGKLLPDIELATIKLCMLSSKLEKHVGGRIKYEKTDRYAYVSEVTTTGIADVDNILSNYQAPLYVGYA